MPNELPNTQPFWTGDVLQNMGDGIWYKKIAFVSVQVWAPLPSYLCGLQDYSEAGRVSSLRRSTGWLYMLRCRLQLHMCDSWRNRATSTTSHLLMSARWGVCECQHPEGPLRSCLALFVPVQGSAYCSGAWQALMTGKFKRLIFARMLRNIPMSKYGGKHCPVYSKGGASCPSLWI